MFAQVGMHLLRKANAAHWQWPPFPCPSPEGSPRGDAAAAFCLTSITGKPADGSPSTPEAKDRVRLLTLTSIIKGATSACKEKEKKGKGLGHVSPLPSLQWL